jgi:hypothetical protein
VFPERNLLQKAGQPTNERQELGERVVKVLGRPPVREDLDRLEKFLLGQETYGNHFTKAMSGKPQESELSTLSTLKNGLRAL